MSKTDNDYIVIGKLGATYGIKGWQKIHSYTENVPDILSYIPWYLEQEDQWLPIQLTDSRIHGKGIIGKLKGIATPEEAKLLIGKKIAIKREQLPKLPSDEYYWDDLIGLTVINQEQKTLGVVSYLIETGANDVLVIKDSNNKEHGVPYLPDSVILRVDLATKTISVNWDLV